MYLAIISLISLITLALPWWAPRIAGKFGVKTFSAPVWLPIVAAFCWAIAGFLPDIHISRETTTFQEHFVGGGMYTGLLYFYLLRLFCKRFNWFITLVLLYAWTSALGVANELFEFTVTKLNITHIDITDTSWDLTANTAGMVLIYLSYLLISTLQKVKNKV